MPRKITAIDSTLREMLASVRSKVSCAFCSRLRILIDKSSIAPMVSAWLASIALRSSSVRLASCSDSFASPSRSATVRSFNRCSAIRCRSLSARSDMTGMVCLDRIGIAAGFLGGRGRERKIIGVGGDQHRGKGLAGLSERRPDRRVAVPGSALDDRNKARPCPAPGPAPAPRRSSRWSPARVRSSPKPLRKRSVTRSSSSTDPDRIGSVEARVVSVPSTASRSSRISAKNSGLGWLM